MKDALYYGDNLEVLREHVGPGTVDLVYLDPPFNSNRNYNVIFARRAHKAADAAQIQAFEDTWHWTPETDAQYHDAVAGGAPMAVADALHAMHSLLGENDAMAYLVNMAPRLVELHRVLKPTGSIYLHCDPTMSHYLKVLMDSVFGPERFRGEITWKRTTTHSDAKRWSPVADNLLYYTKGPNPTWHPQHGPHDDAYLEDKYRFVDPDGRRYQLDNMTSPNPRPNMMYEWKGHASPPAGWRYSKETMAKLDAEGRIWYPDSKDKRPRLKRYLDEMPGVLPGNIWTDISPINSRAAERLGYPTQKPLALLERIIAASSNEGDLVLDPFCGCGTTVDAAARLKRRWIGIDITYLAVDLIIKRLQHTFGDDFTKTFDVLGIPRDDEGAKALFVHSPTEFERWAVSLVNGTPRGQAGDKGVDGVVRFFTDAKNATGRVIVSVKGGDTVGPQFVRDLLGTIETQKAELGLLITRVPATRGMVDAADHAGTYTWPVNGEKFSRIQLVTVGDLLGGKRPKLPPALTPYIQAPAHNATPDQLPLDDDSS